ncbi:MAG: helix-turn-helix domain-containing protein [Polyangiales bacterium]
MHGLPLDVRLREAIVSAKAEGKTYVEIARLLNVGEATVSRVLRRHRENGSVEPRPRGGGNFSPIEGKLAELLRRIVTELSDGTIDEITAAFIKAAEIDTSRASVMRAMQRLGFTRKKRPSWRWSATPSSAERTDDNSARS